MNALKNMKDGIGKAWGSLSREWSHFLGKASRALTRFTPLKGGGSDSSVHAQNTPQFGLVASEIMENDSDVIARIKAPGMETGDFQVEVLGGYLQVKGSKDMKREEKGARYYIMERAYGSFTRSLPLPAEVEVSKASAKYKNGVLNITLPKSEKNRKKRIEVMVQ